MENRAYVELKKRIKRIKCTPFNEVPDSERIKLYGRRKPAVEFEIKFRYPPLLFKQQPP